MSETAKFSLVYQATIVCATASSLGIKIPRIDAVAMMKSKMIQEYYRQMRKFGCNILAVVQQYDIIKDSAVRGAMIGNSKMLSTVGFRSRKF